MFGYIRIYKPELKIKDYEIYRGAYCSLCRELDRQFGLPARFILSYDGAFLALLKMSVIEEAVKFKKSRCPFNPAKKCNQICTDPEPVSYAANVCVLLFYYKISDNIRDDGFCKRFGCRLIYPLARRYYKKAARRYPGLDEKISDLMQKQAEIENNNCNSIDLAADCSAKALAEIFKYGNANEAQSRVLERLGYCLGRWVYCVDAYDDIKKDIKSKSYNPFVLKYSISDNNIKDDVKQQIEQCIAITAGEVCKAYELLDINRFGDILSNILYDGLPYLRLKASKDGAKVEKSI